jgi:hypothetical protein
VRLFWICWSMTASSRLFDDWFVIAVVCARMVSAVVVEEVAKADVVAETVKSGLRW